MNQRTAPVWERASFHFSFGAACIAVAAVVRILSYPVITTDYTFFLSKWFDALRDAPGLTAFQQPFTDYAPLYPYAIKLLTFLPISSLYSIKTLSVLFEILMAALAAFIVWKRFPQVPSKAFLAFAVVFALPTVVINGALWGQSDAIYASGVIAALYFMLKDRPLAATVSFSLALCVKAQAVFFLPVLAGYLWYRQRTKFLLLPPLLFALSIVPAWFAGGSFFHWLVIYVEQAQAYPWLSVSAQSIFAFANPLPLSAFAQDVLFYAGLGLGLLAALGLMLLTLHVYRTNPTTLNIILVSLICVLLLLPYVLPRMHERYFFLADLLSVLYAFYDPRRWYIPVIVVFTSLISYMPFLSGQVAAFAPFDIDLRVPAAILLVVFFLLFRRLRALGNGAVLQALGTRIH